MTAITLKLAEKKDAAVLFDMLHQLSRDLEKENEFFGSVAALEKFGFSDAPAFEAIIAWRGEEALGFVLYFFEFSSWRGAPGIYVQDLFVRAEARGLGLGEKLTSAAIARGKEKEAVYMRLMVHESNDSGFGFYNARGFTAVEGENIMLLEFEGSDH